MQNNAPSIKAKTVLVVEDDQSLRELLEKRLNDNDLHAITASDGDDALYKSIKHKPDLIILDVMLPKMSGMELLHIIRKHEWGKNIPVIVLTNNDDIEVMNESIKHGVHCHYIKSNTSLNSLMQTIQGQLAN